MEKYFENYTIFLPVWVWDFVRSEWLPRGMMLGCSRGKLPFIRTFTSLPTMLKCQHVKSNTNSRGFYSKVSTHKNFFCVTSATMTTTMLKPVSKRKTFVRYVQEKLDFCRFLWNFMLLRITCCKFLQNNLRFRSESLVFP